MKPVVKNPLLCTKCQRRDKLPFRSVCQICLDSINRYSRKHHTAWSPGKPGRPPLELQEQMYERAVTLPCAP